jgi:hypothetical protein
MPVLFRTIYACGLRASEASGGYLHHEQHVQPHEEDRVHGEEVDANRTRHA